MKKIIIKDKAHRWSALGSAVAGASLVIFAFFGTTSVAVAGPYGFDLHNVFSPRAAGMAGTTIAGAGSGPVEALYGNPANLTDLAGGSQFAYGAALYYPEAIATHGGLLPCAATIGVAACAGGDAAANAAAQAPYGFEDTSNAEFFTVPQIAVTQDLAGVGLPIVFGLGLSAPSGIGVQWRGEPRTLGAAAEFIVLGINAGVGYQVNDSLDLGAAATISYGMLEAGLAGGSGQGHDYGVRMTLGGDYHLNDRTDIGFYYQTELEHKWQDFILLGDVADGTEGGIAIQGNDPSDTSTVQNARYRALTIDQPANYALGFSHQLNDNIRIAGDAIYKVWSEAQFWERFYHDQTVVSAGVEYTTGGSWTWRAGYGYANNPTKANAEAKRLEGHTHACVGAPGAGACFPLTGDVGTAVWDYLQAFETPVIYEHRITAGFTYEGFLAPFLTLDVHAAHQLQEDSGSDYAQSGTELEVQSWHGGFALTWGF